VEIWFGAGIAIRPEEEENAEFSEGTPSHVKSTAKPTKKARKLRSAKKLVQSSPLRMAR
jgi:hypothetical protein